MQQQQQQQPRQSSNSIPHSPGSLQNISGPSLRDQSVEGNGDAEGFTVTNHPNRGTMMESPRTTKPSSDSRQQHRAQQQEYFSPLDVKLSTTTAGMTQQERDGSFGGESGGTADPSPRRKSSTTNAIENILGDISGPSVTTASSSAKQQQQQQPQSGGLFLMSGPPQPPPQLMNKPKIADLITDEDLLFVSTEGSDASSALVTPVNRGAMSNDGSPHHHVVRASSSNTVGSSDSSPPRHRNGGVKPPELSTPIVSRGGLPGARRLPVVEELERQQREEELKKAMDDGRGNEAMPPLPEEIPQVALSPPSSNSSGSSGSLHEVQQQQQQQQHDQKEIKAQSVSPSAKPPIAPQPIHSPTARRVDAVDEQQIKRSTSSGSLPNFAPHPASLSTQRRSSGGDASNSSTCDDLSSIGGGSSTVTDRTMSSSKLSDGKEMSGNSVHSHSFTTSTNSSGSLLRSISQRGSALNSSSSLNKPQLATTTSSPAKSKPRPPPQSVTAKERVGLRKQFTVHHSAKKRKNVTSMELMRMSPEAREKEFQRRGVEAEHFDRRQLSLERALYLCTLHGCTQKDREAALAICMSEARRYQNYANLRRLEGVGDDGLSSGSSPVEPTSPGVPTKPTRKSSSKSGTAKHKYFDLVVDENFKKLRNDCKILMDPSSNLYGDEKTEGGARTLASNLSQMSSVPSPPPPSVCAASLSSKSRRSGSFTDSITLSPQSSLSVASSRSGEGEQGGVSPPLKPLPSNAAGGSGAESAREFVSATSSISGDRRDFAQDDSNSFTSSLASTMQQQLAATIPRLREDNYHFVQDQLHKLMLWHARPRSLSK